MSKAKINPDLQKERNAASINSEELACLIFGGSEALAKKRKIEEAVFSDPDYKSIPLEFLSREEVYEECMRRCALTEIKQHDLKDLIKNEEDRSIYASYVSPLNPMRALNRGMFIPTIMSQGTEEQKEKWAKPALKNEILGTYAQTEMGHGTFLRGLETTAHYDPHTQEFVLNTPTISSMKWWPGTLGKTANYAVVLAQLYTKGKCHGIHSFILQLRSLEDHSSLPGITLGDIGPKFGYSAIDNGYLKLNNCRIPRENMLMKYSRVAPDGSYSKSAKSTLTYGTMTLVRSMIVKSCATHLAAGVTIAVRYSCVRRQSEMRPGEPEPQIIDYLTQQHKLFPLLATAYAFHFVQLSMVETCHAINAQVQKGDFSRTQELHALSSALKAYSSWIVNGGLELLRMSCGGHGFSQASGFPQLYSLFTPNCTYEGENTVLMLQTARYLVKCVRNKSSSLPGSVSYLSSVPVAPTRRDFTNLNFLGLLFCQRAYNLVMFASSKVDTLMKNGADLVGAINDASIFLVQAANAHAHYFVVKNFFDNLKSISVSDELRRVLKQLGLLYALDGIDKSSGEFLENNLISGNEAKNVRQMMVDLLPKIRINAVALVDAFDKRDEVLQSVLGRHDGNVYENLFKWAQNSPLNKTDVHPTYYKYLRPLFKQNQAKL